MKYEPLIPLSACPGCFGDNIIGLVMRRIHNQQLSFSLQRAAGFNGLDSLERAIQAQMLTQSVYTRG